MLQIPLRERERGGGLLILDSLEKFFFRSLNSKYATKSIFEVRKTVLGEVEASEISPPPIDFFFFLPQIFTEAKQKVRFFA